MAKKKLKPFKKVEIPTPLPCPCCGKHDLYIGPMSSDSQGVHCIHVTDSIVGIMLMANRKKEKVQQAIIESAKGCGLKMVRSYPEEYPKDLQGYPFDVAHKELERRTLAVAITAWNERCESKVVVNV